MLRHGDLARGCPAHNGGTFCAWAWPAGQRDRYLRDLVRRLLTLRNRR